MPPRIQACPFIRCLKSRAYTSSSLRYLYHRDFWLAAEEVLAQLTDQLNRKKAQLQDAGDKLSQVQQAIADQV